MLTNYDYSYIDDLITQAETIKKCDTLNDKTKNIEYKNILFNMISYLKGRPDMYQLKKLYMMMDSYNDLLLDAKLKLHKKIEQAEKENKENTNNDK